MSRNRESCLFFVSLPDARQLCFITLYQHSYPGCGDLRSKQLKNCRDLLLEYPEVLVAPEMELFGIIVIMTIDFFKSKIINAYMEKHNLQASAPQRVLLSTLQICLSYTLMAWLAPDWNKAGEFLISGKDFLSTSGKLNAIVMEVFAREGQLCVSLECNVVRLPPPTLEEFDIAPNVVQNFKGCRDSVLQTSSIASSWCYVLPSMKKGQIISIGHQLPPGCPFQTYSDVQKHWNSLYGYQLPQANEEDMVYCNVYFKMAGDKLFTYPLCCIRTQPVQVFPRVDLQGSLHSFLQDLRVNIHSICGFPFRITSKPCYYTTDFITPFSQGFYTKPLNLTSKSINQPVLSKPASCLTGGAALRCPFSGPFLFAARFLQSPHAFASRGRIVPMFKQRDRVGSAASRAANSEKGRTRIDVSLRSLTTPRPLEHFSGGTTTVNSGHAQEEPAEDWFESNPNKLDVDVERFARNNQLSKINAATLKKWLKTRGVLVRSKDKKEVLITKVLKVLNCLSES